MTVIIYTGAIFTAFITVKSLSIPSGVLSSCCTHTHTHSDISVSINDSSSHRLLCTVTDKRQLNIAVSIYCLCVCSLPPPSLFISPASQTTENLLLLVNWPGSGERIVAKCSSACLSLTFRLFCSALHQQTKTQPWQIKPSLSQSACLSHRHAVISQPHWSV